MRFIYAFELDNIVTIKYSGTIIQYKLGIIYQDSRNNVTVTNVCIVKPTWLVEPFNSLNMSGPLNAIPRSMF